MTQQEPTQLDDLADEQLIERYRLGQVDAFNTLVYRYQRDLFHFLIRFCGNRVTAEDVFQDAFLQVHLSLDSFDTSRRFKPWLFTIAANKARDMMRKAARRPAGSLDASVGDEDGCSFVDILQADLPGPETRVDEAETSEKVRQCLDGLPDHLREIVLLAYFQRFSYQEIADVLKIPLGTVKSRLHTAVGSFAKSWKSANPADPET